MKPAGETGKDDPAPASSTASKTPQNRGRSEATDPGSSSSQKPDAPPAPPQSPPAKTPAKRAFDPIPAALMQGQPDAWDGYFQKHKPAPPAVAQYVLQLLTAKKHDHIVALIEAALLHGQSQPWMYEVLAVSMEAIRRPAEDIERVLLSAIDFTTVDIPNLLYSATYLANFGRDARALVLCRQASRIDPTRPEPYTLGMKIAAKLKDHDGLRWAITGTLSRVWTRNYADLHRQAQREAVDLEAALRKAGKNAEAESLTAAVAEAQQRDLCIEVIWSGHADLELIVEEPSGTICQLDRPRTAGGGVFVHDGYGPSSKNTYEKYLCPRAMSGDYRITIRHLYGEVVGKRAELKITRYQGTPQEATETLFVSLGEQDKRFRAPLNRGRLKELLPTPVLEDLLVERSRKRPSLFAMARGGETPRGSTAQALAEQGRQVLQQAAPVGYQPIITVISEGVTMQANAIVSADRRYVRMTLAPVFSTLTDVQTFSFFSSGNNNTGGQQPGQGNQPP